MTTVDLNPRRSSDNPFLALPGAEPNGHAPGGAPHANGHLPTVYAPPIGISQMPARPELSVFRRLHSLLRGRYALAGILCTIGVVTGAVLGFRTQRPEFTSTGLVELQLVVQSTYRDDRLMLMANQFMGNQVSLMTSQRVLDAALTGHDWQQTGRGATPAAQSEFKQRLLVEIIPGTTYLRVSYQDPDPAVSKAAVDAVIRAYQTVYGEVNNRETVTRLNFLEQTQNEKTGRINERRSRILVLAQEYGSSNLDNYHAAKQAALVTIISELESAKVSLQALVSSVGPSATSTQPAEAAASRIAVATAPGLAALETATSSPVTAVATPELSEDEIATVDPSVRDLLRQVREASFQLRRLEGRFPANHRTVLDAEGDLKLLRESLGDEVRSFRARYVAIRTDPVTGQMLPVSTVSLEQLKDRVAYLQKRHDRERDEVTRLGERKLEIQSISYDVDRLKGELDVITRNIETLRSENLMSSELKSVHVGSVPGEPSKDNRRQMALLGGAGGALLPLGLLLLIGLIDSRYRFSDDHGQHLPNVPLLGILPHLPNLSTDPHQATVAAHCVHQIRTMLEIAADTQGRRSFAITSPSPGDGKTSLSLALGLSFAAAGSRTLLIDCDVIGGGLSARMNQAHPRGTLEAVAARDLSPFVQPTDVANLSILPVGAASQLHPTILSPSALGRLLTDAKSRYDVVLVDTGPILGSVEASPACAACDATVVVISRGRQRAQVARALDQLVSIGARLAGVVFNRASNPDFERSTSRLALRQETSAKVEA